jgi:hypothetical protein
LRRIADTNMVDLDRVTITLDCRCMMSRCSMWRGWFRRCLGSTIGANEASIRRRFGEK